LIGEYQDAIGDIEQTLAGEDHEYDGYLRKEKMDINTVPPVSTLSNMVQGIKQAKSSGEKSSQTSV